MINKAVATNAKMFTSIFKDKNGESTKYIK